MRVLFCGYRAWATDSLLASVDEGSFSTILFVGWSWIIPEEIVKNTKCVCLHPSPLPKYRGGSPIQHQVIRGEKVSAVTLFEMDQGIDTGPVLYQKDYSLQGTLESIFTNITEAGIDGIKSVLGGDCTPIPQDNAQATFFKRRTPEMSEIVLEDFTHLTAEEVFNKVRCLQSPYPLAYIECKNNTKLYIKEVVVDDD